MSKKTQRDRTSAAAPVAGAPAVAPNFCESCAMDLATCDCVSPRPVAVSINPAPKPIGHFVRHAYDANGELMSSDAV
jgi:hypothetical protein